MKDSESSQVARITARLRTRNLLKDAQDIAQQNHVSIHDLLSRRKTKSVSVARKSLYRTLRNKGLSNVEVGELLERDATSVLAGLRGLQEESAEASDAAAE